MERTEPRETSLVRYQSGRFDHHRWMILLRIAMPPGNAHWYGQSWNADDLHQYRPNNAESSIADEHGAGEGRAGGAECLRSLGG